MVREKGKIQDRAKKNTEDQGLKLPPSNRPGFRHQLKEFIVSNKKRDLRKQKGTNFGVQHHPSVGKKLSPGKPWAHKSHRMVSVHGKNWDKI